MAVESKDPEEIVTVTFPYAREIGAAAINSVVVTIEVTSGIDAGVAAMLNGAAVISGSDVLQSVKLGINGNDYEGHCLATLSDGRKLKRTIHLPARTQ